MSITDTRINRETIVATDVYKRLSKIQKSIVRGNVNVKNIFRGLNIAREKGFDQWAFSSNAYYPNKLIVKELLDSEKK